MKNKYGTYGIAFLGLVLLGVGIFLIKTLIDPQGILKTLPYILVGLGCGIFGHSAGNIFSQRVTKNHPEIQKQMEIDTKDERNITISNSAKAKAYDMMLFVFGALMLAFSLMNVDLIVVLMLLFAYLFVVGCDVYYHLKYDKEM